MVERIYPGERLRNCGGMYLTAKQTTEYGYGTSYQGPWQFSCYNCGTIFDRWTCTVCGTSSFFCHDGSHNTTVRKISAGDLGYCFIATAVYGVASSEVFTLREFRDNHLKQSYIGKKIIKSYYFLSPSIAKYLRTNPLLTELVKNYFLDPIVNKIEKSQLDNKR